MRLKEPKTGGAPPKEAALTPAQEECATYGHEWRQIGTAKDGTTFSRCKNCGLEVEG